MKQSTDFKALYEKYAPDVFRFALYLSGNRADAEDIAAETFLRAWTSPQPIALPTVKAYLLTIARNLFLRGLRRGRREAVLDEDHLDSAPGVAARLEQKASLAAVLARLGTLPEIDRSAVLMRALDGLPYLEIAMALGITENSARVKVHRARALLMNLQMPERLPPPRNGESQ